MIQTGKDEQTSRAETRDAISEGREPPAGDFYCPRCGHEVEDPLTCGDCLALICRVCGTPLESADDLGIG